MQLVADGKVPYKTVSVMHCHHLEFNKHLVVFIVPPILLAALVELCFTLLVRPTVLCLLFF